MLRRHLRFGLDSVGIARCLRSFGCICGASGVSGCETPSTSGAVVRKDTEAKELCTLEGSLENGNSGLPPNSDKMCSSSSVNMTQFVDSSLAVTCSNAFGVLQPGDDIE
ncbi:hypothetical protein Nepgr_012533 [Nepenthes gracilis]|uniref:Uncharacterized protein n=1 Tax=Nepenthes gracilis TaxID=150966 RepID=A0AAD3XMV9_NEPGR|nr:hypothetical protein Nepgr_012533 [Nepenthes gracilis]